MELRKRIDRNLFWYENKEAAIIMKNLPKALCHILLILSMQNRLLSELFSRPSELSTYKPQAHSHYLLLQLDHWLIIY